jgi:hypothetical protein
MRYGHILRSSQVKRLKKKVQLGPRLKTDKSKVFHLGTKQDYEIKSKEYMDRTKAYLCLDNHDPLPDLIHRTNKYKYLLDLRFIVRKKLVPFFI